MSLLNAYILLLAGWLPHERRPVFAVKGRRLYDISKSKAAVKHTTHPFLLVYYAS